MNVHTGSFHVLNSGFCYKKQDNGKDLVQKWYVMTVIVPFFKRNLLIVKGTRVTTMMDETF